MRIYHLRRIDVVGYDEVVEFVIAAEDARRARLMASNGTNEFNGPGAEGGGTWMIPRYTKIRLLGTAARGVLPGILVRNFRNG